MASDAFVESSNIAPFVDHEETPVIPPEKQFVKFALTAETPLLLSVINLVEILTVPTNQVFPVFQMPPWVMGVYNWRGDVLWIVDFNHLLGFLPWYQQLNYASKHTVVVVRSQSDSQRPDGRGGGLGLVVNRVNDITVCEPELIRPVTDIPIPATIQPFLDGYRLGVDGQPEWVVNGESILSAMPRGDA
jgi:positive phototaxis protein PixI